MDAQGEELVMHTAQHIINIVFTSCSIYIYIYYLYGHSCTVLLYFFSSLSVIVYNYGFVMKLNF